MVQFVKSDSAPRGTLTGPAEVDPIFNEVIEALAWSDKKSARIAGTILARVIERAEYVRLCSEGEHVIFRVVFPGGWNELTEGLE